MIKVYIPKELKPFETDIRDLCLAFFTLQKITYVFEDDIVTNKNVGADTICPTCMGERPSVYEASLTSGVRQSTLGVLCESGDIIVKDYYTGDFNSDRLTIKNNLKRELYTYLSNLTGKKLLWGTLTGIRPVTIITKLLEEGGWYHPLQDEDSQSSPVRDEDLFKYGSRELRERQDEKIKNYLQKEYYISDEKVDELIKIARKEIEILNRDEIKNYKNSYSIYVGVPFCKSTCLYCSFTSYNIEKFGKYVDRYLDTLEKDFSVRIGKIGLAQLAPTMTLFTPTMTVLASKSEECASTCKLIPLTLYIGGGTPTSLNEGQFERLLTLIDRYVDRSKCVEYTIEAGRADTINKEKLLIMKNHGVTRISINPQSFNQKTLDLIGRKHTTEDVVEKFKLARDLGFNNINMDIILGLPNEHLIDVLKTLNGIRKLKPDSLTVHSLALKRAARLNYELESWTKNYYLAGVGKRKCSHSLCIKKGSANICSYESLPMQEGKREIDKMFRWSERLAKFLKLNPYYLYRQKNIAGNLENVGYAKDKKECIYNIMMMSERHSVYGFGTGTTKEVFYENGGKRIESEEGYKSVIDYCERVGG